MTTRKCPKCGKELVYKNKYVCELAEKNNRRCYSCRIVNKKGTTTKCSECETPLYRRPSQLKKRKHHFCSSRCQSQFASKYLSGKNNKLWKGGDERNRDKYRQLVNGRKLENKKRAVLLFGGKCECGYDKCIDALEFHHINPKEKDVDVSKLLGKMWGNQIETELKKCKLLCSNCHKEYHWKERHA